jgi:hypothetical protein
VIKTRHKHERVFCWLFIYYRKDSLSLCLKLDTKTYSKVLDLFLFLLLVVSQANAVMMLLVSQVFITAFTFACSDYGRLLVSLLLPNTIVEVSRNEICFSPTTVNIIH